MRNTQNVLRVDAATHARISGYYSSIQPFTGGQTVRQWLSNRSFQTGDAYSISEDGRIVNGDLSSDVFVPEPTLHIPTIEDILRDMPPPSIPELDEPFRPD